MTALRQKLYSQRGASIVLALLFFLVCLTVGGVILTAAAANAGRLSHMRTDQQEYFTVSSAARLLRDDIQGAIYTVKTIKKDGADAVVEYSSPDGDGMLGVNLGNQLCSWAKDVYDGKREQNSAISLSVKSENGRAVYATAYMRGLSSSDPYSIELFFLLPANEGETASPNKSNYAMRLYIPAAVSRSEDTSSEPTAGKEVKTTVATTVIAWGAGVISQAKEDGA